MQIKKMTDRDIARLWSQYVKELAVLLVRAEGMDPPQEVIARMEELVCRELLLLYIRQAAALLAVVRLACAAAHFRIHLGLSAAERPADALSPFMRHLMACLGAVHPGAAHCGAARWALAPPGLVCRHVLHDSTAGGCTKAEVLLAQGSTDKHEQRETLHSDV